MAGDLCRRETGPVPKVRKINVNRIVKMLSNDFQGTNQSINEVAEKIDFWLRQELRVSVCLSVRPSVRLSGTSLSKALNLHLSLIVMSQICLRSVSGQSQVSLRSV